MRVPHFDEPVLHEIIDTQTQITHIAANPGLPDFIPTLRNLPAFLSTWKRATDKLYAAQVDLYMRLFDNGRKSPGWNATKQALATAEKHARSPPALSETLTSHSPSPPPSREASRPPLGRSCGSSLRPCTKTTLFLSTKPTSLSTLRSAATGSLSFPTGPTSPSWTPWYTSYFAGGPSLRGASPVGWTRRTRLGESRSPRTRP